MSLLYSTVKNKLNAFLRDEELRIPTPDTCVDKAVGYTFKYADVDAFDAIKAFVEYECGNPDFVEVRVDTEFGGMDYVEELYDFVCISMKTGELE